MLARLEGDEVRITTLRHRLERAQRHVRQFVKPGVSLADEPSEGKRSCQSSPFSCRPWLIAIIELTFTALVAHEMLTG